ASERCVNPHPRGAAAGDFVVTPAPNGSREMMPTAVERVEAELGEIMALLAAQPSVAFYEQGVAEAARGWLWARGVRVEADGYGNLLARAGGTTGAPLVVVAHMDHPGAHMVGRD